MRLTKVAIVAVVVLAIEGSAKALLVPISLDQFLQTTRCGYVVTVESTEDVSMQDLHLLGVQDESPDRFTRKASLAVLDAIGQAPCSPVPAGATMLFSTEVHSSRPEPGDRALLFVESAGQAWVEAVYGRSYWLLKDIGGISMIEVNWRNSFLLEPLDLRSGEYALVPLSSVTRLLERQAGNQ